MPQSRDFTAYTNPILAVPCPTCNARAGAKCRRPSGHPAAAFHKRRGEAADTEFIAQHGPDASIERTDNGWHIDPTGRIPKRNTRSAQLDLFA